MTRRPLWTLRAALLLTLALTVWSVALARDDRDRGVVAVDTPVATESPASTASATPGPDTGTGIVYLTITNEGDADDALVSARTDRSERVETHESVVTDGIARMTPMGGELPIPAGESVAFEPVGAHLMLVNLTEDIRPGDTFDLVLEFAEAGAVTIPVTAVFNEKDAEGDAVTVGDLTIDGVWSRPAPRIEPGGTAVVDPAGTPREEHDGH